MSRKVSWILAGLAAAAAAGVAAAYLPAAWGPGGSAAGLDAEDPAKVALGARVYAEHCASCHGADLEGEADWRQRRPDGRLPAPPHDASGHTWHHPGDQLFALTKHGPAALVGGGYQSDMPGYEGILTDDEIWAVLSYIKSRWPAEIRARHDRFGQ
ncbi:MAG: c-type cytochrome [Kiloniellaceae bacterium]